MTQISDRAREERRLHRSNAHRAGTWGRFLNRFCDGTGYEKPFAAEALSVVLNAFEQRLRTSEGDHLEAQLPAKLQELVRLRHGERRLRPRQVHAPELITMVAEDLDLTPQEAEGITRDALAMIRMQVTEPEARRVEHILPVDLRLLWGPSS